MNSFFKVAVPCLLLAQTLDGAVLAELDAASLPAGEFSGQTGRWNTNVPVRVETVREKPAIVFDGTQVAISELLATQKLTAFSVEAWVLNPDVARQETIAALTGPKGGSGVECNFSSGASAGAFRSGFKATTPFASLPTADAWHHVAWCFDGSVLRVFVDGEADLEKPLKVSIPAPMKVNIGASGEVDSKGPRKGFSGALAKMRVHDVALTHDEVRAGGGFAGPFAPEPRNGATTDSLAVSLRWKSSDSGAAKVFAGTDRSAVEQGKASVDASAPFALTLGATYFWRVEQSGKSGPLWTFQADRGWPAEPHPRDATSNPPASLAYLKWKPGKHAVSQRVFFSTKRDEVDRGTGGRDCGPAGVCQLQQPLAPGTTYFWRVDSENSGQPKSRGDVWSFRTQDAPIPNDVTFFVGSDTHYGRENNAAVNRRVIDAMNALPGNAFPTKLGAEPVRTPRGVILTGDLVDEGFDKATAPAHVAELFADYGLDGTEGRLCFPLYEGFGNHDGGPVRSLVRPAIKERNQRRAGLKAVSENGLHYSWDWDHLHLVQLNLFGGSGPLDVKGVNGPEHDPSGALEFLRDDLAKHIGNSGRPVIVFQHFAWVGGMAEWWTPEAKERFREVIKPYRIACLINGHSHGASFVPWNEFLTIHAGSTARGESDMGDFLVVRVTEKELVVAQRKLDGTWGIQQRAPLPATPPHP